MIEGLGHPANGFVLAQLRAAVRMGVAPSVFRGWAATDQLAVIAVMTMEAREAADARAVHKACGHPVAEAFNPATEGWFEGFEMTCNACNAIAEYESRARDAAPGTVVYAVNTMTATDRAALLTDWDAPHIAQLAAEARIRGDDEGGLA